MCGRRLYIGAYWDENPWTKRYQNYIFINFWLSAHQDGSYHLAAHIQVITFDLTQYARSKLILWTTKCLAIVFNRGKPWYKWYSVAERVVSICAGTLNNFKRMNLWYAYATCPWPCSSEYFNGVATLKMEIQKRFLGLWLTMFSQTNCLEDAFCTEPPSALRRLTIGLTKYTNQMHPAWTLR